ncbi:glyoxalase domain-containing protein 4-like [Rhopilema esculentum]|uniref:glyoxalase domain-containing protein 4-like n=1 Tax=Rhopilema esculentum TaxID=499914 RepID=UPI0031CE53FF|eukprot:gene15242-6449_t
MATKRALHFVFKIANRKATTDFYRNVLGMKILRHEEFEEGCKAACNGPYDGKWSKSMVGYGPEDDHFVVELTYNYGIKEYKVGNDFQGLSIYSTDIIPNAKKVGYQFSEMGDDKYLLQAPDGYKFYVYNKEKEGSDPVKMISLGVSNLQKSIDYWNGILGMNIINKSDKNAVLNFSDQQCSLELIQLEGPVDHATAFGRIAFSCVSKDLPAIEQKAKDSGNTILTPLVSLDTPGKATVQVVILADPDGHEICFVGDEAFRELSQPDPAGDHLINEAIEKDKSDEWFAKKKTGQ